jgi:SsrA-binding protein
LLCGTMYRYEKMLAEERLAMSKEGIKVLAQNKKARHDYFIEETYEAGIVLTGTEIKSIRRGRVNLKDGYAGIRNGEAWLYNVHISEYEQGNRYNHDPVRTRKLLLHRSEIYKLLGQTKMQGYSLVPLRLYLKGGFCKVEIGLAKGKKNYDKRESIKQRDAQREMQRALRDRNR